MKNKLSCEQVIALYGFYVDDKLNSKLKILVEQHLKECTICREFYSARNIKTDEPRKIYDFNDDYLEIFSEYIDNELDENEAVRVRKITITNPIARKKLENMYTIKKEMHNYFNKIKSDCKLDYSKSIISLLSGEKVTDSFNKLVWTFTAMLTAILAGFIAMLYF